MAEHYLVGLVKFLLRALDIILLDGFGELDTRYRSLGSSSFKTAFRNLLVSQMGTYNDDSNSQVDQVPLSFDELSPSQFHRDGFSLQSTSKAEDNSLWSRQPFQKLFGMFGIGSDQILVGQSNARRNFK